jgi:TP901 family phage tail tape measure protein
MSTLRTSMIIDLSGNLQGKANQFLGSMQKLGTGGARSMQALQRSLHATGQGLDRLGNRYTALLTGAAGIGAIKQVGDLSMRLTRLGLDADASADQVERLKKKVFEVAQMKDIRVDPGQIFSGVEAIVSKLGDWNLAENQLRNIGLAMRATGSDGEAVGAIIADLNSKMKIAPDDMLKALTIIRQAGKAGSFEMKDFVAQGPRIAAAMAATGRTGTAGLKEMMAIMQVFRSSAGSPEEATTAFKNFFADLISPEKQKLLKANNIQIFDPEEMQKGKFKWRSPIDLMDEIIKKTHGDPRKWGQLLGMQTRDGFNAVMAEWQNSGTNPMRKFLAMPDNPKLLLTEAEIAAREFNAALENIHTALLKFAVSELTVPIQRTANFLNSLKSETVERWLKIGTAIAAVVGAAVVVNQVVGAANRIGGMLGKGGKGGVPGLGGMGMPIPVYVVNKHLSMLPGQGWGFPGGGDGSGPGVPTKAAKVLATASKVGGSFAGGYAIGTLINIGIGAVSDKVSGGKYKGSGAIGEWLYDVIHREAQHPAKKQEVGGEIRLKIESDPSVKVKGIKSVNKGVPISVYSGLHMASAN